MIQLLLCLMLGTLSVNGADLEISLDTASQAKPIYFAPWSQQAEGTEFDEQYLNELGALLKDDLNTEGLLACVASNAERIALAQSEGAQKFDAKKWGDLGVLYVVRGVIEGTHLHLWVDGPNRTRYAAELSGRMNKDRRQMHRLSDAIYQDLCNHNGIAATQILYTVRHPTSDGNGWRSEVWIADYDGYNARPITNDGSYCVTPNAALGDRFAYVSYRTGQPKVYVGSSSKGRIERLTSLRGNQLMPALSATGQEVAFISDAGGNPDLFLYTPGAKPRQIFSARGAAQASPTFSPDGKQIAFVSNKDGSPRVYILDIPSEGTPAPPRLITRCCRENTCPVWSPDGRYIAYSAITERTRQIWIYDTATECERQLTFGQSHKENPSWAPDSFHLVFNSDTRSGCELFILTLADPNPRQITSGPGEKRFPSWIPTC